MSACMNDWPTHDMLSVDYTTHHSVIAQYQQNEGTPQDMWLPVRRSSIYGPLLYYSSVNYGILFFLVYILEWLTDIIHFSRSRRNQLAEHGRTLHKSYNG
jgi:hypothetical protein